MRTRFVLAGLGLSIAVTVAAQNPATAQAPAAKKAAPATPAACGPNPPAELKNVAQGSRCFELRTYTVRPGGQGDADLLHKRFREATLRFFQKHGMDVVGFWAPVSKPDTLIYVLAYENAAARDRAWAAFSADPEWLKARAEMAVDLTVANEFMISTDYGPMK